MKKVYKCVAMYTLRNGHALRRLITCSGSRWWLCDGNCPRDSGAPSMYLSALVELCCNCYMV